LFSLAPVRSSQPYDPWADIDDNRKINMNIGYLATMFGAGGDPTKNVTVTNWPVELMPQTIVVYQNYTVTFGEAGMKPIGIANVAGYRYVSIFVGYYDWDGVANDLAYGHSCLGIGLGDLILTMYDTFGYHETGHRAFEVGAPSIAFKLWSHAAGSQELTIILYCYN
jgi:hypothetical protein